MHLKITTPLIFLFLFIFCLKNEGFASQAIQFAQERPMRITLPQSASSSTVMVSPDSVYSAQVKVEGEKNREAVFTTESQTVQLTNSKNKKLMITGVKLNPKKKRFNDQSLILVYLGGQIHLRSNQSPGRYTGKAFIQGRYLNGIDGDIKRYPVQLSVRVLAKIDAVVLRNLNFGQVISDAQQNQVRVLASSSDVRSGCISVNGEERNQVKINYPLQVNLKYRSAQPLHVLVSSSVDNQSKILRLDRQGGGEICFGGLLTVPAHTTPGKYRGKVNVQLFYP